MKKNRLKSSNIILFSAVIWLCCTVTVQATASGLAAIIGEWRIVSLKQDPWRTKKILTPADDPTVVGRKMVITAQQISANIGSGEVCRLKSLQELSSLTLDSFLQKHSGRSVNTPKPKAEDFALKAQTITPILVSCQPGDYLPFGNSLIHLADDTLLTSWYDSTYLLMQRITADENIQPTFDCAQAASPTEQAICSDKELASLDKSIQIAQEYAIDSISDFINIDLQSNDKLAASVKAQQAQWRAALNRNQQQWLKQRNQCQADRDCLQQVMSNRIAYLVYSFKDTINPTETN